MTSDEIILKYERECQEIDKFINVECFDKEEIVYLKDVIFNLKMKFSELKFYLNRSKVAFSVVRFFPELVLETDAKESDFGNYFKIVHDLSCKYSKFIKMFEKKSDSNILEKQNVLKICGSSVALLGNDVINSLEDKEKHDAIKTYSEKFKKTKQEISEQVWDLLVNIAISIKDEETCVEAVQSLYFLGLPKQYAPTIIEIAKSFKEENVAYLFPRINSVPEEYIPFYIEVIKGLGEDVAVEFFDSFVSEGLPEKYFSNVIEAVKDFAENNRAAVLAAFCQIKLPEEYFPIVIETIKNFREENAVALFGILCMYGLPEKYFLTVIESIENFEENHAFEVFRQLCVRDLPDEYFPKIIARIKHFQEAHVASIFECFCDNKKNPSEEHRAAIIELIQGFQENNMANVLSAFCKREISKEQFSTVITLIKSFKNKIHVAQVLVKLCKFKLPTEHRKMAIKMMKSFKKGAALNFFKELSEVDLRKEYLPIFFESIKQFKEKQIMEILTEFCSSNQFKKNEKVVKMLFELINKFKDDRCVFQVFRVFCRQKISAKYAQDVLASINNFKSESMKMRTLRNLCENRLLVQDTSRVFEFIKNFAQEQNFVMAFEVFCSKNKLSEENLIAVIQHTAGFKAKNAAAVVNALCKHGVPLEAIPTLVQFAQKLQPSERELAVRIFQLVFTTQLGIQTVYECPIILENQELEKIADEAFDKVLKGGKYTSECLKFLHSQASAFMPLSAVLKHLKGVLRLVMDFKKERNALRVLQTLIELGVPEKGIPLVIRVAKRLSPPLAAQFFEELIGDELPLKYIREIVDCVEGYPLNLKLKLLRKLAIAVSVEDRATIQLTVMQLIGDQPEHMEEILALHAGTQGSYVFGDNIIFEKNA
ncbi:MAG: hypothetical protein V4494_08165 [Chlamydiota bacterium]